MGVEPSGHFSLMLPLMQWLYSPEGEALGQQAELPTKKVNPAWPRQNVAFAEFNIPWQRSRGPHTGTTGIAI
jgi:hypothetical protein